MLQAWLVAALVAAAFVTVIPSYGKGGTSISKMRNKQKFSLRWHVMKNTEWRMRAAAAAVDAAAAAVDTAAAAAAVDAAAAAADSCWGT
jgi:hypothetical protein